jgi:2-keto-4-pentenoate hydratase/2-oxohepta-3-ene-1,7-dioic acid hydratase in catechol pathway
VTKDEIADPQNLPVKLWVNGECKQDFNTNDMAHQIARCIEWAFQKRPFEEPQVRKPLS